MNQEMYEKICYDLQDEGRMPTEMSVQFCHDNDHRGGLTYKGREVVYYATGVIEYTDIADHDGYLTFEVANICLTSLAVAFDDEEEAVDINIGSADSGLISAVEQHILDTMDLHDLIELEL